MMDIVVWLRSLGLGKCEAVFRENEIDETVLPSFTEEHLKQLGVTALGHRLKLLDAIAALRPCAPALIQVIARNTCHSSGMPFRACVPKSSNLIPEPATRSLTVRETRTSSAPPMLATRDAM